MNQVVFIKDKPICLSDEISEELLLNSQLIVQYNGDSDIELTVKLFEDTKSIKSLLIYSDNYDDLIKSFQSKYKILEAAGGIVFNDRSEALFIYRFDRWDLPKGKLENGETPEKGALREVEEECGISNLKIEKSLQKTFHCFEHYGEKTLKITHWYKMSCSVEPHKLTPQTEEGITEVKWFSGKDIEQVKNTTYGSIINVIEEAFKS